MQYFCVTITPAVRLSFTTDGYGIFNVRTSLGACHTHEGGSGTNKSEQERRRAWNVMKPASTGRCFFVCKWLPSGFSQDFTQSSPIHKLHCVLACSYLCVFVCLFACLFECMFICVYVCMYACVHVCMYVCMFVWMYVCVYVCAQCLYVCPDFFICT